jgi:hypothetical protein
LELLSLKHVELLELLKHLELNLDLELLSLEHLELLIHLKHLELLQLLSMNLKLPT